MCWSLVHLATQLSHSAVPLARICASGLTGRSVYPYGFEGQGDALFSLNPQQKG